MKSEKSDNRTARGMRDALKKATTEMLVLFLLRQKPMYTYEMIQSIEQLSGGVISFHNLYLATYRLQDDKYIQEPTRSCRRTTAPASTSPSHQRGPSTWSS